MRYLIALIVMFFMLGQCQADTSNDALRVIVAEQGEYISELEDLIDDYNFKLAILRVQKDYAEDQLIASIGDRVK